METKQEVRYSPVERWLNEIEFIDGCDLETEARQAREEGKDLSSVEARLAELLAVPKPIERWTGAVGGRRDAAWRSSAIALVDEIARLPQRADCAGEPSTLEEIKRARPQAPALAAWCGDEGEWRRKLHGGLLARMCGCMLGKPVEGWARASIRANAEVTGNWPLTDYLRMPTEAEKAELDRVAPRHRLERCWDRLLRGTIEGMVEDDDINYTMVGFAVVKRHGASFEPAHIARFWCDNIPVLHTFTAERAAYRNFLMGVPPPESAALHNPYREWIGAQIRADYFGYANPGNPERAAEWAWRDAAVSHVKNGIYGEMWVAAMLAAAYVETDWHRVIRAGLAQIPAGCRLREAVDEIVDAHLAGMDYEGVIDLVHARWNEAAFHDWCHTISNAQLVTIGLLWGEDDFEKTIARAVMGALDTDCNGATCGSLWGVMHGVDALPQKWAAPLGDTVHTGVAGYHTASIRALAAEMVDVAKLAAT